MEIFTVPLPGYIPKDLCAFEKRVSVDPERWDSGAWAIWIRTWYGNESVARTNADEAYLHLWQRAFHPMEHHGEYDEHIADPFVFDDDAAACGVASTDADDEVELMGELPPFVLSALMRCPDALEGSSESGWSRRLARTDEELNLQQVLLVLVADREACEEGWVLLIALNHRGQVLHMRQRCKAYGTSLNVAFWRDKGEPLDVGGEGENVVYYRDANRSGDGWDDDTPS